ncbi:SPW repeat domain-containing protein [Pseudothermotoga lettingae]|uniref:SPW repeat domain-containing protein n=1 Tax=Pseudothermotoga lettingae TaxID=177758 RepID=UPI0007461DA1|nr:SPW repeat protein [Pseudothermotoga lettingae]KUK20937.1 MAG: Uncharacterized protein XD56_1155 [Pseudothermotoga lettingae]HBT25631.1 hypothetical protein [Pseudothermotoga sp.]
MSWKGWLILLVALWLIVSVLIPNIAGSKGANLANFLITGIIFAAVSAMDLKQTRAVAWIILIVGIWLIISSFIPSITGSKTAAMTNGLIMGIINLILSFFMKKSKAS